MKLTLSLLLLAVVSFATDSYSQSAKLTLKMENATLVEIFQEIERTSDIGFLFKNDQLDLKKKYIVDFEDNSVEEILKSLLGDRYSYQFIGKNVVITVNEKMNGTVQQQKNVTGKVTDSSGTPLPGVTVVVKGTSNGMVTDTDGNYALSGIPSDAILVFSFVGMKTQEVKAEGKSMMNVKMEEETIGIDEVVAVGYGTQKKVNLTGAITTADIKKMENRPITNASQALQGLNGIYVNQAGGQPGKDAATIRIRGVGTLNNNDPLVLVDGIAFSLMDVNPNDIESISVLKDAASTAVYGSRAANGVILVTTKQGKRNQPFRVDYNTYFGIEQPTYLPDVEWDPIKYMEYKNQALTNEGKAIEYKLEDIEEYRNGMDTDPYTYPQTNWFDEILRNGFMHEHNVTLSGGSETHNLALTLGYLNQDGILNHIKGEKYTMGLNAKVDVTKFLSVGGKISGVYRKYNEPWNNMDTYWQGIYRSLPIYPVRIADGRYGNSWLRTAGQNTYQNVVERLESGINDHFQQRLLANLFADVKLPFNITYKINLAVNKYDYKREKFSPMVTLVNPKTLEEQKARPTAVGFRYYNDQLNATVFNTLEWSKTIANNHNLGVLVGNSYESFKSSNFESEKESAMDNTLTDLDVFVSNPQVAGNSSESAILSYFGRLNYNFGEKYLFEVNFRYDGSSRFAKGNRWGFFPSFSLGWRMDQENFMKNITWLSTLKPRLSWGKIGNQEIALFSYANTVALGKDYSFGTTVMQGAAVTASSDPRISWETTTMTNFGLDGSLFDGKLSFVVDLYNKKTEDILRPVNLPSQVANWTGPTSNIGEVNNKGFEFSANYHGKLNEFSYEVGGNFAYNKNEVVNLNGQQIISGRYITAEGHPIDSYYILEAIGIFQSTEEVQAHAFQNVATKAGYIKYKDQNDDKKIDANDRVIVDGVVPKLTYSFNLAVGYKGFDLAALFQGVGTIYTYPQHNISYPFYNGAGFTKQWETESWTTTNTDAALPILTTSTGNTLNFDNSTFWLRDASYLRLKNLQLSYTFPDLISKKLSMKRLKVFVNGQNLLTFSKMDDFDPEKNMKNDNIFEYPSLKIYTMGLNVTF
ncbi:MAG: hypothetical protein A2W89_13900 [Bacteroidetes bacterium GWE2_42_39]|nr:MAG: hypothetical protein A2W92_16505 [Bacteroidetes bacterium GWA2_42_15]OFY00404.1 MAG: hypothetical protein A2W89_13900 [Bacteroidetes bacterium GWE2_42_39]